MYRKAWKPSKTAKREFAEKMREIENFCAKNGIHSSLSNDSYYFTVDGINYRLSNHSVEASNRGAFDETTGEQKRELYHQDGREDNTVYIHASKTRIIEIYNDIVAGYKLDGRGNRKDGLQ